MFYILRARSVPRIAKLHAYKTTKKYKIKRAEAAVTWRKWLVCTYVEEILFSLNKMFKVIEVHKYKIYFSFFCVFVTIIMDFKIILYSSVAAFELIRPTKQITITLAANKIPGGICSPFKGGIIYSSFIRKKSEYYWLENRTNLPLLTCDKHEWLDSNNIHVAIDNWVITLIFLANLIIH